MLLFFRIGDPPVKSVSKVISRCNFPRYFSILLIPVLLGLPACTSTKGLSVAEADGTWSEIKNSGVHEDVNYVLLGNYAEPVGASGTFLSDVKEVTWWAHFGTTFAMAFTPTFEAKWFSPDGKVHLHRTFKKSALNDYMLKTKMPVAGTSADKKLGEWAVEVYFKGHRIDRKTFKILTPELIEKTKAEEIRTLQAKIETKKADAGSSKVSEDPWYEGKYEDSKKLFAAGDYKAAGDVLREILDKQPYRSEAHLALASIHYKQKRYADSVRELDFAIQNPELRDQAMTLRTTILELQKTEAQ